MQTIKNHAPSIITLIVLGIVAAALSVFFSNPYRGSRDVAGTPSSTTPQTAVTDRITCSALLRPTTNAQGDLIVKRTDQFAEYDIHLDGIAAAPVAVQDELVKILIPQLCEFVNSYHDGAIPVTDQQQLGFIDENGQRTDRVYSYNASLSSSVSARWGIMTYVIDTHQFTGGAHGIGMIGGVMYDTVNNTVVRPADIVSSLSTTTLRSMLEKKLMTILGDYASIDMIRDGLSHPETVLNVMIPTDTGMTIRYNDYIVGPYAVGQPEFGLTFAEMTPFISNVWNSRLGL